MKPPARIAIAIGTFRASARLVSGSTSSSLVRLEDLAGGAAEVTVPIPAGGVGEAMAMAGGQRYAAPAREVAGLAVARGATVTIVAAGPTLVVRAGPPVPAAASARSAGGAGGTQKGDRSHG